MLIGRAAEVKVQTVILVIHVHVLLLVSPLYGPEHRLQWMKVNWPGGGKGVFVSENSFFHPEILPKESQPRQI